MREQMEGGPACFYFQTCKMNSQDFKPLKSSSSAGLRGLSAYCDLWVPEYSLRPFKHQVAEGTKGLEESSGFSSYSSLGCQEK